MKKITEFKSVFSAKNVLTFMEMANLKGGVSINAVINAGGNANSNSAVAAAVVTGIVTGVTADDKRRERPGGGISTL